MKLKIRRFFMYLKRDVFVAENLALLLCVFFCLLWAYQSISAMSRNWTLTERLSSEQRTLELLELETEVLSLENEYYKTAEYQELAARKSLNKKLPGETMVVLPANTTEAKQKYRTPDLGPTPPPSNWEKWLSFLFPSQH